MTPLMEAKPVFDAAGIVRWSQLIRDKPRGRQRWDSRVRVWSALIKQPDLARGDVATLCRAADSTASSTFYSCFGPASSDRLVNSDSPMMVALEEARSWTLTAYLVGANRAIEQTRCSNLAAIEALLRATAEWALRFTGLAVAGGAEPPTVLIGTLARFVDTGNPQWAATATSILQYVAERPHDTSLTAVNTVRAEIRRLYFTGAEVFDASAEYVLIDAMSRFAEGALDGQLNTDDPLLARVGELMPKLLALLQRKDAHE